MTDLIDIQHARAKRISDARLARIAGDPSWLAEEKLDGWRFMLHFGGGLHRPYLVGRRASDVTGQLSEKGLLVSQLWPSEARQRECGYTALDGEIMPPPGVTGIGFRHLASIMNASPEVSAATIARIGPPVFRVFDAPYWDGHLWSCATQKQRSALVADVVRWLGHELIRPVESRSNALGLMTQKFYDEVVARGGEGLILKRSDAAYGESGAWVKWKRAHSLDVVITDFTDAEHGVTGKYDGQIGAACVSVYDSSGKLVEVGRVSGMDDETRLDMTSSPGEWLGCVAEILAQGFGRARLRHPRFVRRRPDAHPGECTMRKMMADLGAQDDSDADTIEDADDRQAKLF